MGRWENEVNSTRKAHKGNALHMLDCSDRTADRGVGSKQQRKQIAGERRGQSQWWQDATALGVRTPLVVCRAGLRLARLAKWASFRNILDGGGDGSLKKVAASMRQIQFKPAKWAMDSIYAQRCSWESYTDRIAFLPLATLLIAQVTGCILLWGISQKQIGQT